LLAFVVFALQQIRRGICVLADNEEHRGGVFLLENVENFRSPVAVRPVVKGKHNLVFYSSDLIDIVRKWDGFIFLAGDQVAVGIVGKTSASRLWHVDDSPNVSGTLKNQVRAGWEIFQLVSGGVIGTDGVPDRPDGSIRSSQTPHRCALNAQPFAGAQLVVGRDRI